MVESKQVVPMPEHGARVMMVQACQTMLKVIDKNLKAGKVPTAEDTNKTEVLLTVAEKLSVDAPTMELTVEEAGCLIAIAKLGPMLMLAQSLMQEVSHGEDTTVH